MGNDDKNKINQALKKIIEDDKASKLILRSLNFIRPSKKRSIFLVVFYLLSSSMFLLFFNNNNAKENTLLIVDLVNMITIPILALAITGFSIFQALVSGKTLINLLKSDEGEYSKFQEYNLFFFSFSLLYLFAIILNFMLKIIVFNLDQASTIPIFNVETNSILYTLGINLYITFICFSLLEVKSFVYNLYQIFSINAVSEGIEYIKKENNR